jgi:hypothetical protein
MAAEFSRGKDYVERRCQGEAWSSDCIRVRSTLADELKSFDWRISPLDPALSPEVIETEMERILRNGTAVTGAFGR